MATVHHGDEALRILGRLLDAYANGLASLSGEAASIVPESEALLASVRAFQAECKESTDRRRDAIMREIL